MTPGQSNDHPASDQVSLDTLYAEVRSHILDRQHPISGLLPASTAVTAHGDYTDAWVRDNVYSILAPWALGIACRRAGDSARAFELEQAVVRNMRGLLLAMMRQAERIERFKLSLDPLDALHAKYDTASGAAVVGDEEWGHLQLDATSLFVLMLVQMTAGGLTLVRSRDEVDFVQNLIWYLSRAYVIPDYGIWERGNKINHGVRELNASSLGLVLAALEAADGFDLFGAEGDDSTRLQVVPDDIVRVAQCLDAILPRESASKEIDSALLAVIGFPAFAAGDKADEVSVRIEERLAGRYGYKRFLRDGHQTAIEDEGKLYYDPEELEAFAHIECEWPLFLAYRLINACFAEDRAAAESISNHLKGVAVAEEGLPLLPELYYVPAESVEAERQQPGSTRRLPNENRPLVWAQSLWVVGRLLCSDWLRPADLDPLGRHQVHREQMRSGVAAVLLAETPEVADRLTRAGIGPVTLRGEASLEIVSDDALIERFASLGENARLGLTGRPRRRLLALATARVVSADDGDHALIPALFDTQTFPLGRDIELLVHEMRTSLIYLARHDRGIGRLLFIVPIADWMLDEAGGEALLAFCRDELTAGAVNGANLRLEHLDGLTDTAAKWRLPGDMPASEPTQPMMIGQWQPGGDPAALEAELGVTPSIDALVSMYSRAHALEDRLALLERLGRAEMPGDRTFPDAEGAVRDHLGHLRALFQIAQQVGQWRVMRLAAEQAGLVDGFLEVALMDLIVQQKQLAVGRSYTHEAVIDQPISNQEILRRIAAYSDDDPRERALTQELVIHLGSWLRAEPTLFDDVITLRTGPLLQILVALRAREAGVVPSQALDDLVGMRPNDLRQRLREALDWRERPERLEALHRLDTSPGVPLSRPIPATEPPAEGDADDQAEAVDWYHRREIDGAVSRLPERFYEGVWQLLGHVPALVIGSRFDPRSVLDSSLYRGQSTSGEHNFALEVEHRLNRIEAPEYRQLSVEALTVLIEIAAHTPELSIEEPLVLDVLIGHAVRLAWLAEQTENGRQYDERRADAWQAFYQRPPWVVARWIGVALDYLLGVDIEVSERDEGASG